MDPDIFLCERDIFRFIRASRRNAEMNSICPCQYICLPGEHSPDIWFIFLIRPFRNRFPVLLHCADPGKPEFPPNHSIFIFIQNFCKDSFLTRPDIRCCSCKPLKGLFSHFLIICLHFQLPYHQPRLLNLQTQYIHSEYILIAYLPGHLPDHRDSHNPLVSGSQYSICTRRRHLRKRI